MSAAPVALAPYPRDAVWVVPFEHPQGRRSYLVADPTSRQAMAIDPHADLVGVMDEHVRRERWSLSYVVDTHTHGEEPSGSAVLAKRFLSTRISQGMPTTRLEHASPAGQGETLRLGDVPVRVRLAASRTPDHVVLLAGPAVYWGATLLDGGGRSADRPREAGRLFDTLCDVLVDADDGGATAEPQPTLEDDGREAALVVPGTRPSLLDTLRSSPLWRSRGVALALALVGTAFATVAGTWFVASALLGSILVVVGRPLRRASPGRRPGVR